MAVRVHLQRVIRVNHSPLDFDTAKPFEHKHAVEVELDLYEVKVCFVSICPVKSSIRVSSTCSSRINLFDLPSRFCGLLC